MTKIQCFFNGVWYIALKRQTVFLCSYITHKSLGPLMYKDRWWWWGGGGWWRWWLRLSFSHNSKTTSWLDPRTQNKETTSCTERKSVRHLYYIYNIINNSIFNIFTFSSIFYVFFWLGNLRRTHPHCWGSERFTSCYCICDFYFDRQPAGGSTDSL